MTPEESSLCTDETVPNSDVPGEGLPEAVLKALRADIGRESRCPPSNLNQPHAPLQPDANSLQALTALLRQGQRAARNAVNLQRSAAPKGAINNHTQLNTSR